MTSRRLGRWRCEMSPSSRSIVVDYEENGASVAQIAEAQEVGVEAVEAVLWQFSDRFRKEKSSGATTNPKAPGPADDISDSEHRVFVEMYKELALNTENEKLRARMLENLIDEKKGRKDWRARAAAATTGVSAVQLNVFVFNRALARARETQVEDMGKVLDVEVKKLEVVND